MEHYILVETPEREGQAYGVMVPSLPGCFSAGDSYEEAIANAEQAIIMHIEDMIDRGDQVPESKFSDVVEALKNAPGQWTAVRINIANEYISGKAVRVNVTIPEGLLSMIDARTKNRSAFLADAAFDRLKKGVN